MNLVSIGVNDADRIAPLVAGFRTTLNSYKGIVSEPDLGAAKEEIIEYLDKGYPVYAAEEENGSVRVEFMILKKGKGTIELSSLENGEEIIIYTRVWNGSGLRSPVYGWNISSYARNTGEKALRHCFSARLKRSLNPWVKIRCIILFIRTMKE